MAKARVAILNLFQDNRQESRYISHSTKVFRHPALDAGLGFLFNGREKSLTPYQARGDETEECRG
jgi:hypothetical protein